MNGRRRADVLVVALLALVALGFLALEVLDRRTLERITVEDGAVESLQALLFLVAGVLFIAAAVWRSASKVWCSLLGLGCILVAGEEISWGQRILGVGTPESLAEVNVQGETNLHNLEGVHGMVRGVAVLVLLAVFVVFPLLVARWEPAGRLADRWAIPRPPLVLIPVLLIGLAFQIVPRLIEGGAVFRFDEVGELYMVVLLLLFAVDVWRNASPKRQPVPLREQWVH
jgi:hypothetical protein